MSELGVTTMSDEAVIEGAVDDNASAQGSITASVVFKREDGGEKDSDKTVY